MDINEGYFFTSGMIPGKEIDNNDYLKEYMLSTVSSIKEDLILKFPQETSEFYIYTKYSEKNRILTIYVTLLRETKINYRKMNINFMITIDEKYPQTPPKVFCQTDVYHINI